MNTPRRSRNYFVPSSSQQPLAPNIKRALRAMRREDNKQTIVVNGPNDPKVVKKDVVVTKVVEDSPTATGPISYTYSSIYKLLDNQTVPFFTEMRVIGCSLYGQTGDASVSVTVPSDGASYVDHGVAGSRRPAIHLRFPEITRITWAPVASTTAIVTGLPTGGVYQFTIEVRGDASGNN